MKLLNHIFFKTLVVVLVWAILSHNCSAQTQIPFLKKQGSATQLIKDASLGWLDLFTAWLSDPGFLKNLNH